MFAPNSGCVARYAPFIRDNGEVVCITLLMGIIIRNII
ncbi:MAG: hypothetical protein E6357_27985 [Clostridiales bacterium]|nr:hypothetical protein [Clostridiales bacterium]